MRSSDTIDPSSLLLLLYKIPSKDCGKDDAPKDNLLSQRFALFVPVLLPLTKISRDQVVVCVAGVQAQAIFDAPTHEGVAWADYGKVIGILGDMPEKQQRVVIDAAHKRAREIIIANHAKVARLAQRLIDNGSTAAPISSR